MRQDSEKKVGKLTKHDSNTSTDVVKQPENRADIYQLVRKLNPPHKGAVICAIIVGGQMWVGCGDGTLRIWEIEAGSSFHKLAQTGQMLEDRKHHTAPILSLLLVKDKVWSCSKDKQILVWSPKVQGIMFSTPRKRSQ